MLPDAFDTLGLPPRFDLDATAIRAAYLSRAALVHPDTVGNPDAVGNDDEAARAMARLNEAKSLLESPEKRAEALLLRLRGPTKEQDRSLPEGFLAETLELRERIDEEMGAARDAGGDQARARWAAWADSERRTTIAHVAALLARAVAEPSPQALRDVRLRLNAWRYLERLIEQLDPAREGPPR